MDTPFQPSPAPITHAERWLRSVKTPEFVIPPTWEEWLMKRTFMRTQLEEMLGSYPPPPVIPQVTVVLREECDGYTLEKFRFENGLGMTVPGYLLLPKPVTGKVPAILYCHWHGEQYERGKEEMLANDFMPEAPGPALARRGYAVLGIDACCFGERHRETPDDFPESGSTREMTAAKFCLWAGRTLWGVMVRDDRMALDYLCSRPEIDTSRIGVTGASMGSTRAWWLMALDDRLRAAACIACMTRYQDLIRSQSLKAHGIYYFVPGMLQHFDSEAVIALAAPRAMLFQTGDQDAGSPLQGIRTIESKLDSIYQLAGARSNYQSLVYPGAGHVYLPEMWERTLEWFDSHLKD